MNLRSWNFKDILRISQLEKECFPAEPWSYRMLADSFQSENFVGILCDDGGEIAGYGGLTCGYDTADIDNIAVAERYRGNGIGGAILENLFSSAAERGMQRVFLEVRVSNAAAMSLYLKHGFKGVYARTRYYSDGEDCLVMARDVLKGN